MSRQYNTRTYTYDTCGTQPNVPHGSPYYVPYGMPYTQRVIRTVKKVKDAATNTETETVNLTDFQVFMVIIGTLLLFAIFFGGFFFMVSKLQKKIKEDDDE